MIREEVVAEIVRAIVFAGPDPTHHYETILRHRAEWPVLWRALDKLLVDYYAQDIPE